LKSKSEDSEKHDAINAIGLMARQVVRIAELPPEVFLQLFTGEEFNDPKLWLDERLLGSLLGRAFISGHLGAIQAVEELRFNPSLYTTKLVGSLNSELAEHVSTRPELAEIHFELTITLGHERSVAALVRTLQLPISFDPILSQRLHGEIDALRRRFTGSRRTELQRIGYKLWIELVRHALTDPPAISDLQTLLPELRDEVVQGLVVNLIEVSVKKDAAELESAVGGLFRIAHNSSSDFLYRTSLGAVDRLIASNPDQLSKFAPQALTATLKPPTDAGIIADFGYLIESLAKTDAALAFNLFKQLLNSPVLAEFGAQAKKNLQHYLRRATRSVVVAVGPRIRKELLRSIPEIDHYMQQLIIDAMCHDAFNEISSQLNELLNEPSVWDGTKEIIRRQKYMRERTRGGGAWPELYELVPSTQIEELTAAEMDLDKLVHQELSELQQVNRKVDWLLEGQLDIVNNLNHMGEAILSQFSTGEQRIIKELSERFTENQVNVVQSVLETLDMQPLDELEIRQSVETVQLSLLELHTSGDLLPKQTEIEEIIAAPHLDLKHKLKFSIPIIPLLLEYTAEIEFGNRLNLEALWDRLTNRFRRR
jgi:hypothetical protein